MKENISMALQDFSHQFIQGLSEIHRSLDLQETKEAVVRVASQVFGAKGASLLLFNRTHETMRVSEAYGLSEAYKIKGDVNPEKSIGETLHGNVVVIRDVATDPNLQYPQEALKEGIKVSLVFRSPSETFWSARFGCILTACGIFRGKRWNISR